MRYSKADFIKSCKKRKEVFVYCGFETHYQNGIVEAENMTLIYGPRTALLRAKMMWYKVNKAVLWYYALLATAKRLNDLALDENGESLLENFSCIKEETVCSNWHTWGCPVFILAEANQSGLDVTPQWELRTRI